MSELDQIDDLDLLDESIDLDLELDATEQSVEASSEPEPIVRKASGLSLINEIPVEISVEVSRTSLLLKEMMDLGPENIIMLDKKEGEPVDVKVNGVLFGTGQIIAQEGKYGVQILSLVDDAKDA
ncbi:FliM/FliN family flagellar motor switch protein [Vibrio algivorus]|uniref:Flagellar motor switch protein FliN n=1 Tax=Vibrio algivorus TaxID=1667024 RepID=A0A557P2M9_9VIBR|nr:FliM/FliN family flagellar motor switch protein [Vibrio algivorus]TVO34921.1 FliM/FliN family flagellar motor switch protein [Vibrio algivorus]